jgi:spore coat protein A
MGLFFVRDEFEDALNLPRGKYEIPLVIYDRIFDLDAQLFYPVSDDPKSPWIAEVFGDATLVNGKLFPYLEVEPRKYRLRVLNAANGRNFLLSLSNGHPANETLHQIGTDQGLLPAPGPLQRVPLSPGERTDLIVDFSGMAGASPILKNDNRNLMQFRVSQSGTRDTSSIPQILRPVPKIAESSAVKTRWLTLVEIDDLVQRPVKMLLNNTEWHKPVTESPVLDSVEIWNLVNLIDDPHPIHLHLVRFQVLDRRAFNVNAYWATGEVKYTGPVVLPEPGEAGWKDTVRADGRMVTRIIIRFEGFTGRYVWHCHILEHEDNEMMRPFEVVAPQ